MLVELTGLLISQWEDVYSRAQVHYGGVSSQNDNRAAWCRALRLLKQHAATKKAHPTHVLEKALLHYFVFGGSSSGVEQNFSKTAWSIYSRRHFATGESEEFVAKVVLDSHLYDETELIHLARLAWRMCYGQPRRHVQARVDKGLKRKLNDDLTAGKCQGSERLLQLLLQHSILMRKLPGTCRHGQKSTKQNKHFKGANSICDKYRQSPRRVCFHLR